MTRTGDGAPPPEGVYAASSPSCSRMRRACVGQSTVFAWSARDADGQQRRDDGVHLRRELLEVVVQGALVERAAHVDDRPVGRAEGVDERCDRRLLALI